MHTCDTHIFKRRKTFIVQVSNLLPCLRSVSHPLFPAHWRILAFSFPFLYLEEEAKKCALECSPAFEKQEEQSLVYQLCPTPGTAQIPAAFPSSPAKLPLPTTDRISEKLNTSPRPHWRAESASGLKPEICLGFFLFPIWLQQMSRNRRARPLAGQFSIIFVSAQSHWKVETRSLTLEDKRELFLEPKLSARDLGTQIRVSPNTMF